MSLEDILIKIIVPLISAVLASNIIICKIVKKHKMNNKGAVFNNNGDVINGNKK